MSPSRGRHCITDDVLEELERDVAYRIGAIKGMLKLRSPAAARTYKSRLNKVIEQFKEIQNRITETQRKIDKELSLLHQVKAVAAANEEQIKVMNKLNGQIQSPGMLKLISEMRNKHLDSTRKAETGVPNLVTDGTTRSRVVDSKRNVLVIDKERDIKRMKPNGTASNVGLYSKDRGKFNRYIL